MTYTSVNGSLFKKMVINGAINLKNDLKEIELFLHNKYGTPLNKIYPDKNVYVL